MARKRRRRSVKWRAILIVLLMGNFATGLFFSPITAATSIRVEGAESGDVVALAIIRNKLALLRDVPYVQADQARIEDGLLSQIERLETVDLSTNLFGRGVLKIRYRQPVATIAGSESLKLSRRGDLYKDRRPLTGLPAVELPAGALHPNLTFGFPADLKAISRLGEFAIEMGIAEKTVIKVEEVGRLWFNREGGAAVILGSSDNLDAKLSRLRRYLNENPNGLSQIKELNLTSPEHPAVTP